VAAQVADRYRPDIDGMRAIAVLSVLVFHFDLIPGAQAGFMGVDIFFVISGYLITSIVVRQLRAGSFALGHFYLARIRRLAPALAGTLLLVWAYASLTLLPDDLSELSRQLLGSQTYVANIYFWRNVNYFGLGVDQVYLLHMWSLAVEEQFYLFYPLTLLLLYRWAPRAVWPALALLWFASMALNLGFVSTKPEATFYLLPTRAWELLSGALLTRLHELRRLPCSMAEGLGWAGIGMLIASMLMFRPGTAFPGWYALWPVLATCCLLSSGQDGATSVSRALSQAAMTRVGALSYPLYLVHWPIHVFAQRALEERYSLAWRCGMFVASLALAALMLRWLETPVRSKRVLRNDRALLKGYLAGLAVTVALCGLVLVADGLPQRFPSEVAQLAHRSRDRMPPMPECQYTGQSLASEGAFCRLGQPGLQPRWIVYGDSQAWAARDAFDAWLAAKGQAGLFMFRHACPPVGDLDVFGDRGLCRAFNAAVLDFLATHSGVDQVLLVSTWRQPVEAVLSTRPDTKLSREESVTLFLANFDQTLRRLRASGKQIHIWEPVPGARRSVPQAMAWAALSGRAADIDWTLAEYQAEFGFLFHALRANRASITSSFSPSAAMCRGGRCRTAIDGVPAYFDNAHVARSSAPFLARMLLSGEGSTASLDPEVASAGARP
jgi:peptidoglycan/LPS O-acetylase OafA/YrhL